MVNGYMTVSDIAKALNCSIQKVRALADRGYLTAVRDGVNNYRFFPYAETEVPRLRELMLKNLGKIERLKEVIA